MKKVQVLMSTYNGEMFIREQIDSIIKSITDELIMKLCLTIFPWKKSWIMSKFF